MTNIMQEKLLIKPSEKSTLKRTGSTVGSVQPSQSNGTPQCRGEFILYFKTDYEKLNRKKLKGI